MRKKLLPRVCNYEVVLQTIQNRLKLILKSIFKLITKIFFLTLIRIFRENSRATVGEKQFKQNEN